MQWLTSRSGEEIERIQVSSCTQQTPPTPAGDTMARVRYITIRALAARIADSLCAALKGKKMQRAVEML
jgi:hypothetical protein